MSNPLLTCILHYGKPALTKKVHEALLQKASSAQAEHVLVIDNAAPMPYPKALRLEKNIFWAGALNHALHLAEKGGYAYLWFCNNDITFLSSPPLMAKMQHRLQFLSQKLGKPLGVLAPSVTASPYIPHMVHQKNMDFSLVPYIDGIAPVLSVQCMQALGGLEGLGLHENARGYGLDIWLSLQAHKAGWPVLVDHSITLRHKYHTTASTVEGFMQQAAQEEENFMRARLGDNWRKKIQHGDV